MTVREALSKVKAIVIPKDRLPVELTSSKELHNFLGPRFEILEEGSSYIGDGALRLAVFHNATFAIERIEENTPSEKQWAYFRIDEGGSGELIASHPALLYAYTIRLMRIG